jgi:hypothetical protein
MRPTNPTYTSQELLPFLQCPLSLRPQKHTLWHQVAVHCLLPISMDTSCSQYWTPYKLRLIWMYFFLWWKVLGRFGFSFQVIALCRVINSQTAQCLDICGENSMNDLQLKTLCETAKKELKDRDARKKTRFGMATLLPRSSSLLCVNLALQRKGRAKILMTKKPRSWSEKMKKKKSCYLKYVTTLMAKVPLING